MRHNPILSALLVLVNIAVVAFVAYLAIDALDQSRRQSARTEQSLNRLSDALDRLGENLSSRPVVLSPAADASAAKPGPRPGAAATAAGRFANDDLRDPDAEEGDSLVTRTISLPGNLNYLVNNESTVSTIWSMVVDTLAGRNHNDQTLYEPVMAERWEVSEDGLVYTIHLRKNVLWQPYTDPVTKREVAARPVTSRDFLFFWNVVKNPRIPAEALRTYYEDCEGVSVVDDHTFTVTWKRPYSMAESFTLGMTPLPEHYYRPDPDWSDDRFADEFTSSARNQWIVGTGPYKLTKWDKNAEAVFERDENYYGPKPPIKSRRIWLVPDTSVSFLEFQKGQIDLYGLQPTQWHEETPEPDFRLVTPDIETAYGDSLEWDNRKKAGELPGDYKFEKYQYNSQSWTYVGYNLQRPLFQDREVRVALTHLIDRQRILDEVYLGLGSLISGPFIPTSPYYNHNVEALPFNIDTARAMLADAGWEDTDHDGLLDKDYDASGARKPFQFTFIIPSGSALSRKIAAIIEQDMLKAKIKVDIKPIEWSVYTQLLEKREFDVCSLGWIGGVEGDPYQIWHSSGANREASSNHVGYSSPEADRLIEEGRRTVDKRDRYEIYHRLHEIIAADQPYTFLVAGTATIAQSKRYRNAIVYKGGEMSTLLQWAPADTR
ncbi:MAG: peptide-binding protein [Planctomycetota bacterium]|jgi:ABC-type transport system substrate-binding protein|nr:peptide-binding protein [Planctomycetota bacterium]